MSRGVRSLAGVLMRRSGTSHDPRRAPHVGSGWFGWCRSGDWRRGSNAWGSRTVAVDNRLVWIWGSGGRICHTDAERHIAERDEVPVLHIDPVDGPIIEVGVIHRSQVL